MVARGWQVEVGGDLPELVATLARSSVDLVVTAAVLPTADYSAVVRTVRGHSVSATAPIVLLTGGAGDNLAVAALEQGVTEVFLKHQIEHLESYIDSLCDESDALPTPAGRALVLDDDEAVGLYLSRVLEGLGLVVDRVKNSIEAEQLLAAGPYSLVVADIVLGGGQSGNQFVRRLRQLPGRQGQVPVIAVSGYQDGARRLDALRAGANAYLAKPVGESELLFHAQRLLAASRGDEEAVPDNGAAPAIVGVDLSRRERDICDLAAGGLPDKRIAERLGISYWTVRSHMSNIFRKCGVVNRIQLAALLRGGGQPTEEAPSPLRDALTGLANRVLLRDRGHQAIARARRFGGCLAVLFIDLDRFKEVNDRCGHGVGDALLRELARRMRTRFRDHDTVARYGGDEFAAVLPDLHQREEALLLANKVLDLLARPIQVDGLQHSVGASIGISIFPDDGATIDDLLDRADRAMYSAKKRGGNRISFFEPDLDDRVAELLRCESELRTAVLAGHFVLFFQPVVRVGGFRPQGVEALLRWQHPSRGLLAPGEFLPVAERSSLVAAIGNWVLDAACQALVRLRAAGHGELFMAVNVAALQVAAPDFPDFVARTLAAHGLSAGSLKLELKESLVANDRGPALANLKRLAAAGVGLVLDDFGTGPSGLGNLQRLPFAALKIDGAVARQVGQLPYDTALAQAAVGVAGSLGIDVVAEGLETADQYDLLAALGCQSAQGYLFGRPVPESELPALLASFVPLVPDGG